MSQIGTHIPESNHSVLWTSDNKRWQIRRKHDKAPMSIWLRNRYDYYDEVTVFDVYIPEYVTKAAERYEDQRDWFWGNPVAFAR